MFSISFPDSGFPALISRLLECLPSPAQVLDGLQRLKPATLVAGGVIFWLFFVRALRWRRYNAIHRKYAAKWNNGLGSLSPYEAQEITILSANYDMPWLIHQGVSFALFKTYGIPSISKLLASTKELKSQDTISRRYADTEILISTWAQCPISGFYDASFTLGDKGTHAEPDPRANIALARTNWLHSKYKISNDDFLYTLCLFALEPIYWSERWGWRSLSPLEQHAFYTFWVEIGRRMNIQDIPNSLEDMKAWSKAYEEKCMVPAQTNQDVASYTVDELLAPAPESFGIKAFGKRVAICLLDDITREAMMYEKQPRILRASINGLFHISGFVQRFLLPPRISGVWTVERGAPCTPAPGECPRMHPTRFAARPWYRPESTSGLGYYWDKLLVNTHWHTEMPSLHLRSTGYRLEEMGPVKWEQEGHEQVMRNATELLGCPITGPWSLGGRQLTG